MQKKKFEKTSLSGLGISKSGRLQIPLVGSFSEKYKEDKNRFGQDLAKVGDYVSEWSMSWITKNNTGVVVSIGEDKLGYNSVTVETLSGKTKNFSLCDLFVLKEGQYNEIKEELLFNTK